MRQHHLSVMLVSSLAAASEVSVSNSTVAGAGARPRHNLALAWLLQSLVGLVGVVLNSIVFYVFISERQNMARPVNVLVWCVICSLNHVTCPYHQDADSLLFPVLLNLHPVAVLHHVYWQTCPSPIGCGETSTRYRYRG